MTYTLPTFRWCHWYNTLQYNTYNTLDTVLKRCYGNSIRRTLESVKSIYCVWKLKVRQAEPLKTKWKNGSISELNPCTTFRWWDFNITKMVVLWAMEAIRRHAIIATTLKNRWYYPDKKPTNLHIDDVQLQQKHNNFCIMYFYNFDQYPQQGT